MNNIQSERWLEWAREIQALSQTGNHFAVNDYQCERYHRLTEIAAEIVSEHTNLAFTKMNEIYQAQIGYATPRVDVRGAVFRDGKLLLVRERSDGGWTMPGGWADVGDIPSEAAEREVWEEAGFYVKARKVVGVYDANCMPPIDIFHAFKIVFLCDLTGGEARISNETDGVAFFMQDEIPETLSGERTGLRHIRDAFNASLSLDTPTVFD